MSSDMALLLALLLAGQPASPGADAPLGLFDLPEYRAALQAPGPSEAPPAAVRVHFQDLWNHPETYTGRRVELVGRVVRRFHQPASGTYPALVEDWLTTPQNNLFCVVYPETPSASLAIGTEVRFAGTFLRRIQYQGGDVPRLAPLIVGSSAPARIGSSTKPAGPDPMFAPGMSWLDLAIGLAMAIVVLAILARIHMGRPIHLRMRDDIELPPQFLDHGDKGNVEAGDEL
jgi:hypothetical protein